MAEPAASLADRRLRLQAKALVAVVFLISSIANAICALLAFWRGQSIAYAFIVLTALCFLACVATSSYVVFAMRRLRA